MMSADSGVKSPQPGGELSEGKEGERQRGRGPFIRVVGSSIKAGSKGIDGGGRVTGNGRRREFRSKLEDDLALTKGSHPSVRRRDTGSVKRLPGPRALFSVGLKGFPGVRFNILFLLSPFLFLDFLF
jgi:hypothetical protein